MSIIHAVIITFKWVDGHIYWDLCIVYICVHHRCNNYIAILFPELSRSHTNYYADHSYVKLSCVAGKRSLLLILF